MAFGRFTLPAILLGLGAAVSLATLAGLAASLSLLPAGSQPTPDLGTALVLAILYFALLHVAAAGARRPLLLRAAILVTGAWVAAALAHDLWALLAAPGTGGPGMWLGVCPCLSLLMLCVMLAVLHRREEWVDQLVLALFSSVLALSVIGFTVSLTLDRGSNALAILGESAPCAAATGFIAAGALAARRRLTSAGILSRDVPVWRAIRTIIPLAVLLALDRILLAANRARLSDTAYARFDLALTVFNLLVVGLLINWLAWRLSREFHRLWRSEARLAMAVEARGAGIFDWNVITGDLMWTPDAERAIGLEPGGMKRIEDWEGRVLPGDLDLLLDRLGEAATRRDDHFPFRYRLETVDGRVRTFEGTARLFYEEAGDLARVVGVNLDVTDEEEREAALEERRAQLRSLFATAPDGMIVIDGGGRIRDFNPAAETMFGYSRDEACGTEVATLFSNASHVLERSLAESGEEDGPTRAAARPLSLTAVREDGSRFPAELTLAPASARGAPIVIAFVRDVSERMEAEQRLADLRNDFAHTARLNDMGELAAELAHELNQPLTAAVNFVATAHMLVEKEARDDDLLDLLERARAQSLRAGQIMQRLRDFIAKRTSDLRAEPVEEVVADAVAIALIGGEGRAVRVDFDVGDGAGEMIADPIQIQQVLVNLLRNSEEAMRGMPAERRSIHISVARAEPDMIRFTIEDEGPGFSPEMLERLYTPFLSTKGSGGMGIGLSICRRIVEAHGGAMNVGNKPGGGARVRFTLRRG